MGSVKSQQMWPPAAERDAFTSACSQSHSAVQWLARMANSFQMQASDGSHLHMDWSGQDCAVRTVEIAPGTVVEMRLPELVLQFREDGALTKHPMALDDKSPAEVEAWTLIELLHRGIDRDKYSKTLPYDVSSLLSGDARHYETMGLEAGFNELAGWLRSAAAMLEAIASDGKAADIKFAPELFALFIRLHPDNGRPAIGNYVEAGFCAGDPSASEPCFYVSSKPETLPAARLPISQVREKRADQAAVAKFFAIETRLKALPG